MSEIGFAECLMCGHIFVCVFRPKQKFTKGTPCGHMCGERITNKEVKP